LQSRRLARLRIGRQDGGGGGAAWRRGLRPGVLGARLSRAIGVGWRWGRGCVEGVIGAAAPAEASRVLIATARAVSESRVAAARAASTALASRASSAGFIVFTLIRCTSSTPAKRVSGPCHSPTSYLILRNINILRHNIQIFANIAGRRASRRRHRGCKRRRGRSGAPIKKPGLSTGRLHTMVPLAQRYDVPIVERRLSDLEPRGCLAHCQP